MARYTHPYVPRSGPHKGEVFRSQFAYRDLRARERGYASYREERREAAWHDVSAWERKWRELGSFAREDGQATGPALVWKDKRAQIIAELKKHKGQSLQIIIFGNFRESPKRTRSGQPREFRDSMRDNNIALTEGTLEELEKARSWNDFGAWLINSRDWGEVLAVYGIRYQVLG